MVLPGGPGRFELPTEFTDEYVASWKEKAVQRILEDALSGLSPNKADALSKYIFQRDDDNQSDDVDNSLDVEVSNHVQADFKPNYVGDYQPNHVMGSQQSFDDMPIFKVCIKDLKQNDASCR